MATEKDTTAGVADYSAYIRELYAKKLAAKRAALENAYNANVAKLEASAQEIEPAYNAARNRSAAQSALEKKNFDEYAAANGLNSGTAAQSTLSRSVALQNDLAALTAAEMQELREVEAERRALASQFENAIASALAEGEAEMAEALYAEQVRRQTALQKLAEQAAMKEETASPAQTQTGGSLNTGTSGGGTKTADVSADVGGLQLGSLFEEMQGSGTPYTYLTANYKRYGIGSGASTTLQSIYEEYEAWREQRERSSYTARQKENYDEILDRLAVSSAEQGRAPTAYISKLEQTMGGDYYQKLMGDTLYQKLVSNADRYAEAYAALRAAKDKQAWLKANRKKYGDAVCDWLESKL